MRTTIAFVAVSAATTLASCNSTSGQMVGVRSDGLTVECEEGEQDDTATCVPEDGDDSCEDWEHGGPAIVLWPPNHRLYRFTLDDCQEELECEPDEDVDAGPGDDGGGDDGGDDDGGDDGGDVGRPDAGGDDGGDVDVVDRILPAADLVPVAITSITADEAVEVGAGGDGHTVDHDVAIVDDVTFELRSERQGGGDGRVYRVNWVDADGNPGSCEFLVPHDHRGPFAGAIDSGTVVTVTP